MKPLHRGPFFLQAPTCHSQEIRGRYQNISTWTGRIKYLSVPADVVRRLPHDATQHDAYRHAWSVRVRTGSCSALELGMIGLNIRMLNCCTYNTLSSSLARTFQLLKRPVVSLVTIKRLVSIQHSDQEPPGFNLRYKMPQTRPVSLKGDRTAALDCAVTCACGRVISDYRVIYNVRSYGRPMEWTRAVCCRRAVVKYCAVVCGRARCGRASK